MGLLEPHERHRGRPRQARLSRAPRAIVVHSQGQARAAARAAASLGSPLTLLSGPGAAAYAGPGWFLAIVRAAASAHPGVDLTAILDCGGQPGRALGALRMGVTHLRDVGPPRARKRVAAIAEAMGAAIDDRAYVMLDLAGIAEPDEALRTFLKDKR